MTYSEKLKEPLWKLKRLEILDRDGHACYSCKSITNIEVHHFYYVARREPWDYPNDSLVTVCRNCHQSITDRCKGSFLNFEIAACAVIKSVRETLKSNAE